MHSRGPDRRSTPNVVSLAELGLSRDRRKGVDRRFTGFISRLQLFATIPYDAVEAAIVDAPVRDVAAGEILLVPGQANDAIHLLVSGRLRIHLDHADSADYIPIEEGGCFGELSIIDGRPVSAYVVADQPSRIVTVSEKVVWDRLVTHPGVARNLLKVLSERMRLNGDIILAQMKDKLRGGCFLRSAMSRARACRRRCSWLAQSRRCAWRQCAGVPPRLCWRR